MFGRLQKADGSSSINEPEFIESILRICFLQSKLLEFVSRLGLGWARADRIADAGCGNAGAQFKHS